MSKTDKKPEGAPSKKRRNVKKWLMLLIVLIAVGGGAGAGLYAMGVGPLGGGHVEEIDPHRPQLVVREGVSESVAAAARQRARNGAPDPRVFQATYYPLEAQFTSNLRGGEAFLQLGIGVSTYYDERVVENLRAHEMAVRSAVLLTISEQDPVEITTLRGKQQLKIALRNAINEALTIREGFGGIDDVYFTSFVTQ